MKTEKQIREKIDWYGKRIDTILEIDREEWDKYIIDDLEWCRSLTYSPV